MCGWNGARRGGAHEPTAALVTVMRAFSHVCSLELGLGSTLGDDEA
jgi:hypothetical protein